jgi:Gluconate 2-dehydrogenase subunit 3
MHPENINRIDRREIIKYLALASGLALMPSSLESLASSFSKPTDLGRLDKKGLLNHKQLELLADISDVIIPTTDTPGALAAKAHEFINQFAVNCLNLNEQNQIITTLNKIADAVEKKSSTGFKQLSLAQKIQLLTEVEQVKSPFTQSDRADFKQLKAWVVFAYYTSEIGAAQELSYLAIPGGYKGNVKFSSVGKAWALSQ